MNQFESNGACALFGNSAQRKHSSYMAILIFLDLLLACCGQSALAQTGDWAWMGGSTTGGHTSVYGTLGVSSPENTPGARDTSTTWTDANGDLWLFGGKGIYANGGYYTTLSDLWKYSTASGEWVWMGGSDQSNSCGVQGERGVASTSYFPHSRYGAVSVTDANGNLWLFGGYGAADCSSVRAMNDLWKYTPSTGEWTWVHGCTSDTDCEYKSYGPGGFEVPGGGVWGSLGISSPGNVPSGRQNSIAWIDSDGNIWLYGGSGYDRTGQGGFLDDLWKFSIRTGEWTWMGGSSKSNQPGSYGEIGVSSASNSPGGRIGATGWTDLNGDLWLFGGVQNSQASTRANMNDLWKYSRTSGEWTWMGGSNQSGQPGNYGERRVPKSSNLPPSRGYSSGWVDSLGKFWLFGGTDSGWSDSYSDLWRYDPLTGLWVWFHGESGPYQEGVYGIQGVPAASNMPGARSYQLSWKGVDGRFWMYGGDGSRIKDDLWAFMPPESAHTAATPVITPSTGDYLAAQVVSIASSTEGALIYYTVDNSTPTTASNLFVSPLTVDRNTTLKAIAVAAGYDESDVALARYTYTRPPFLVSPVPGSTLEGSSATFTWDPGLGTSAYQLLLGTVPGSSNVYNGAETTATSALVTGIPQDGVRLFVRLRYLQNGAWQVAYDEYVEAGTSMPPALVTPTPGTTLTGSSVTFSWNPGRGSTAFQLLLGESGAGSSEIYSGEFDASTSVVTLPFPQGAYPLYARLRYRMNTRWDSIDYTYTEAGSPTPPGDWTWMGGSLTGGQYGVYGTLGVPSASNIPGVRESSTGKLDASGNYWLFGGLGVGAAGEGSLNDLWRFSSTTGEWTWMSGSNSANQCGVYGTLGVPALENVPGSRHSSISWMDANGSFWLFGGVGDQCFGGTLLNDLWKYTPSTGEWTWMGGRAVTSRADADLLLKTPTGHWGIQGVPSTENYPSARNEASSWTDSSGNLWFFGGVGPDEYGGRAMMNDLWRYSPVSGEWTWMGGGNRSDSYLPGVYGELGVPSASNNPGGRMDASAWTDPSGDFWLFGGTSDNRHGVGGWLNDLWKYSPATGMWTWVSGSNAVNQPGIYGIRGEAASGNVPSARQNASGWSDQLGNLWVFGGRKFDSTGAGELNDLWRYSPASGMWTWFSGRSYENRLSHYGTLGLPSVENLPGGTYAAVNWRDTNGNLWLFGGSGVDGNGDERSDLNALWRFRPITSAALDPVISPPGGSYGSAQTVTITDATAGAVIHYTLDGTVPTVSSPVYSGPLTIAASATVQAVALAGGYADSAVASATYTITAVATPVFSVPGGNYKTIQTVALSDATPGAVIHYTLNGTTPSVASPIYVGPLTIMSTTTVQAIAMVSGLTNSAVAMAAYTITLPQAATPTLSLSGGTYYAEQMVTIADTTDSAAIYYTTNATTPTTASQLYTGPIRVATTQTVRAIAVAYGYQNSAQAVATYRMVTPMPLIQPSGTAYSTPQSVVITDKQAGAAIYYTLDGTTPVAGGSPLYAGPFELKVSATVRAIAVYPGFLSSSVSIKTYTFNLKVATPTFMSASGTYGQAQMVSLTTATDGARLHYTTDGTVPTLDSPVYTEPIAVNATQTIRAIAELSGWANSAVGTAYYKLVWSAQVMTGLATPVAASEATLNAKVNGMGAAGQVWFVWGQDSKELTQSTDPVPLPVSLAVQSASAVITGLTSGKQYYFQPVVSTVGGQGYGAVQSFTAH